MVKNLPTVLKTVVRSLGQEEPLEKGMATHSSILAWRIPWTEEPGGLQSMGSQRVGHNWATFISLCLLLLLLSRFSRVRLCATPEMEAHQAPLSLGFFKARTLEWVAISFSNEWKWKVKGKLLSRVRLPATPWTTAHQAPPSMGFSRQEYWSGVPLLRSD